MGANPITRSQVNQQTDMQKATVSSSLKYKELIRTALSELEKVGIAALFPNLDRGRAKKDVNLEFMKQLEKEHFEAIDDSEALYVISPQGCVGTLVSVEIGYARAQGKPIIFSEKPEDLGLQALATRYLPLKEVKKLKDLDLEI